MCSAPRTLIGRLSQGRIRQRLVPTRSLVSGSLSPNRPELDFDYLLDENNRQKIRENIKNRKMIGDIDDLHSCWDQVQRTCLDATVNDSALKAHQLKELWDSLYRKASMIPNGSSSASPKVNPICTRIIGEMNNPQNDIITAERLGKSWGTYRSDCVHASGHRSYGLVNAFSRLQTAIVQWARAFLLDKHIGFEPIMVPDVVDYDILQACGMQSANDRTSAHGQVFVLGHTAKKCLSGTGELGCASYIRVREINETFPLEKLPLKFLATTRCYRLEAFGSDTEGGLYRVHEFDKLEMFIVTANESGLESELALKELVQIQTELYETLHLHFRVMEMACCELGASAHRKLDCETWLPARKVWAEISSASNCTDYQARRLNTRYERSDGSTGVVHTINGTAVASTRMLIAILENSLREKGRLNLPSVLKERMEKQKTGKSTKWSTNVIDTRNTFDWVNID